MNYLGIICFLWSQTLAWRSLKVSTRITLYPSTNFYKIIPQCKVLLPEKINPSIVLQHWNHEKHLIFNYTNKSTGYLFNRYYYYLEFLESVFFHQLFVSWLHQQLLLYQLLLPLLSDCFDTADDIYMKWNWSLCVYSLKCDGKLILLNATWYFTSCWWEVFHHIHWHYFISTLGISSFNNSVNSSFLYSSFNHFMNSCNCMKITICICMALKRACIHLALWGTNIKLCPQNSDAR